MSEDKVQLEVGIVIRVDKSDDQGATFTVFNGNEPVSMYLAKGQAAKSGISLIVPAVQAHTVEAAIGQAIKAETLMDELNDILSGMLSDYPLNNFDFNTSVSDGVEKIMRLVCPSCED